MRHKIHRLVLFAIMSAALRALAGTDVYEQPVVYPQQQEAVGEARLTVSNGLDETLYTLSNNVLSATFVKRDGTLYFDGCEAMDLLGGTELFRIALGNGSKVVAASEMTLRSVQATARCHHQHRVAGLGH